MSERTPRQLRSDRTRPPETVASARTATTHAATSVDRRRPTMRDEYLRQGPGHQHGPECDDQNEPVDLTARERDETPR